MSIRWEDLDWARIRRDPRYSAYYHRSGAPGVAPSDIQIVLAAIAGRLGDLGASPSDRPVTAEDDEDDLAREGQAQTNGEAQTNTDGEVDDDAFDDELVRRALPISTRTRMAFNRFVARYAAATRDEAFGSELGPIVAVSNAAIFNHLLVKLLARGAVDPHRAVEAHVALWKLLWGSPEQPGLISRLSGGEREAVDQVLSDARARETTLRALAGALGEEVTRECRAELRELTRHLIVDSAFGLGGDLLAAPEPDPERASVIVFHLLLQASPATLEEVTNEVLAPLGVSYSHTDWRTDVVRRQLHSGASSSLQADGLVVHDSIENLGHDAIRQTLERLAVFAYLGDLRTDYLRVRFEGNGTDVGFWDVEAMVGVTMVAGDDQPIESFEPPWPKWLTCLEGLTGWLSERMPTVGAA